MVELAAIAEARLPRPRRAAATISAHFEAREPWGGRVFDSASGQSDCGKSLAVCGQSDRADPYRPSELAGVWTLSGRGHAPAGSRANGGY